MDLSTWSAEWLGFRRIFERKRGKRGERVRERERGSRMRNEVELGSLSEAQMQQLRD